MFPSLRKSIVCGLSALILATSVSGAHAGQRERDIAIGAAAGVLGAVAVGSLIADGHSRGGVGYDRYHETRPIYQQPRVIYREVPVYRDVPVYREAPVVYHERPQPVYRDVRPHRDLRYRAPEPRYSRVSLSDAHVSYCYDRYRSYRASDNTFQPNHGPRRQCR